MTGSSPRARGTQLRQIAERINQRFIPAGAGNAAPSGLYDPLEAVHPRGRGERPSNHPRTQDEVGSSPRARGTPLKLHVEIMFLRFIPAGAGNAM